MERVVMSEAELIKDVRDKARAWRVQLADMRDCVDSWGVESTYVKNVCHHLEMLTYALIRLSESMRFHNPYYEHDLKMARARELAKRRLAESAARREKEQANG